jgi:hypothetical protein
MQYWVNQRGPVDQVKYRGYLIYLIDEADLWNTPRGR